MENKKVKVSPSHSLKLGSPELKSLKRKSEKLNYYLEKDLHFYGNTIVLYLDYIESMLEQILITISQKQESKMDRKIKSAKKSIDKKMDALVKEDKKHDKKCEHDVKMAKKRK